jgi:hypothetical protein
MRGSRQLPAQGRQWAIKLVATAQVAMMLWPKCTGGYACLPVASCWTATLIIRLDGGTIVKDLGRLDFTKLLGFDSVSDQILDAIDFQDETIGAKLGAKVGEEPSVPPKVPDTRSL